MSKENEEMFEGFDLTNLDEFSSFMEDRDDSSNDDDQDKQQPEGGGFGGFGDFEVELDEPDEGDEDSTKGTDDNEDPSSHDNTKSKDSFLTPYAKLLMDEGVLQDFELEKFDGTADGLVEAFRQQVNKHVEDYKQTLDPRVKWLQDHVEAGVPLETLLNIDKERVQLSQITPEVLSGDKDLQKNIVKQYLKATTNGWSDAKIQKEVDRLDDLGELETEANESFEMLKQHNLQQEQQLVAQAQAERERMIQEQQKTLDTFKKNLDETKEIIPGIQVTPLIKDRIFKTLTTPVAQDAQGNPLNAIAKARAENPLEFEMKLAYLFELTKGFSDWTPLGKTGKKNAIKEFEEAARRLDYNTPASGSEPVLDKASQKEILNAMRMFR